MEIESFFFKEYIIIINVSLISFIILFIAYKSKKNNIIMIAKKSLTFYLSILFFVRSFFLKEQPYIIPLIILVFTINIYYNIFPFTIYDQIYTLILTGIYLIGIDTICSYVSQKIIANASGFWDGLSIFLREENKNTILEYYRSAGLSALIIGKTAMTATGRAALAAAILGGSFMIGNTYLQGRQAAAESQKNRDFQAAESQKNRDFQAAESQRNRDFQAAESQRNKDWNSYNSSWNPFKKPPKN